MSWQSDEPCIACGTMSVDRCYHHIYTRKAHPEFINESWNLFSCCAKCHEYLHKVGMLKASENNTKIKKWLFENGWNICQLRKTWRHNAEQ